jgi:hypothetical protein
MENFLKAHKQVERGGVLINVILSLVSIAVIVAAAMLLAGMHPGAGL